jgi:peptide-methionine (S)-S-oxide reductase
MSYKNQDRGFFFKMPISFPRVLALMGLSVVFLSTFSLASNQFPTKMPNPVTDAKISPNKGEDTAVFAGGCFWGVEGVFEHLKGVTNVVAGFSGGDAATAHYEMVSSSTTDHAESVKITYDPSKISYGQLLKVFFSVAHDPTQLNRQGPDHGKQYRSAIFFANKKQEKIASSYITQLNKAKVFPAPIVTQLVPLKGFYAAEDYHQHFLKEHPDYPYIVINDLPKLAQLKKSFPDLYQP